MIPMDWTHLYSAPIKPPNLDKLDRVKRESASPQDLAQSKPTARHPLTGDAWVRVTATALILEQMWKELLRPLKRIF